MRTTVRRVLSVVAFTTFGIAVVAADAPRTYQTVNMFEAGNPANQLGSAATLYRSKQRLEMRVAASGLAENSAFSVWWVVFNNPAACVGGCGVDDLPRPAVKASVFYAAGFVTGGDGVNTEDGTGNVSASIDAGALPSGIDIETGDGLAPGNGFGAEVHIVVRTHGTINPGHVHEQIGSFNGACTPTCANKQVAVFLPI
jgi:hypothetical protein